MKVVNIYAILISTLLFGIHYFLITYINSSFLENFVETKTVGTLYAAGASITIAIFLTLAGISNQFGNYRTFIGFAILESSVLLILGTASSPVFILPAFILHHALSPILLAVLDIYLEDSSPKNEIGALRGTYLTTMGIAAFFSPFVVGRLIGEGESFSFIYKLSSLFMFLCLIFFAYTLRKAPSGEFKKVRLDLEIREFFGDKNIILINLVHFALQIFYSCMIIFIPLYLRDVIGFSWREIGTLISIALLPFILLQIPVGKLADRRFGEKEFLITGFGITIISLFLIPTVSGAIFPLWAGVLLLTRIGASTIETSTQSYFFKLSRHKDELVGFFKMSAPMAFIVGPIFGSFIINIFGWNMLFISIIPIMAGGLVASSFIKDSR